MLYFVTGTDTNVGKTYVTGLLAQVLLSQQQNVAVYKPVETGLETLEYSDTRCVQRWLKHPNGLKVQVGQFFKEPATPSVANTDEPLNLEALKQEALALEQACNVVLMEGAGGLMVPLTPEKTLLDWLTTLPLTGIVLVTRPHLGTLNHTLLSVKALLEKQLPLHAVLVNEGATPLSEEEKNSLAVQTVMEQLRHWCKQLGFQGPVLGVLPSATFPETVQDNPLYTAFIEGKLLNTQ
jgi:dethiobiotin synthetase